MSSDPIIKVIIPALDEEDSLPRVIQAIPAGVDEIIVVDNGSTDDTAAVARRHGVRVITEPRRGYGQACLSGVAALGHCDIVVFLDADYSDFPEEMAVLLEPILQNRAEMVIGSRTRYPAAAAVLTPVQRFGNALTCRLIQLFWRFRYTDLGPFRAIRTAALHALAMSDRDFGWTIEMQLKAVRRGLRIEEVPVHYRRRIGRSKISGTISGVWKAGVKILYTVFKHLLRPEKLTSGQTDKLIIFSRFPVPGLTKTRLIPAFGPLAAAAVQKKLTEHTLETARNLSRRHPTACDVRYTDGINAQMRSWLGQDVTFRRQSSGDLGRRMEDAVLSAFREGRERVIVIGIDCPAITPALLHRAFAALHDHDLVLGPSTDGGYYLIGLARPAPLFCGISWGSETVLQATLQRAHSRHLRVCQLKPLTDIDEPADLAQHPRFQPANPAISVIIPTLDEDGNLPCTLQSAQSPNAEIIVVDAGSTDNTLEIARAHGARIISSPPGRAHQQNVAAARARGEILLFLHADTRLPAGYDRLIFNAMLNRRTILGAFRYQTDLDTPVMRLLERLVHFRCRYLDMPYGDQGLFIRRRDFLARGGFPDTSIAEDLHFVKSIRPRRGRIAVLPAPAVTSARRYRTIGTFRTTFINQLIVLGCYGNIDPGFLARLYGRC